MCFPALNGNRQILKGMSGAVQNEKMIPYECFNEYPGSTLFLPEFQTRLQADVSNSEKHSGSVVECY